mmetsp:Transcript_25162/g.54750  ORF Transcript_25162/g.54750 Transcript_25162/m.54750 type:complete len:204 (-) Transcript_25162:59-670(-)
MASAVTCRTFRTATKSWSMVRLSLHWDMLQQPAVVRATLSARLLNLQTKSGLQPFAKPTLMAMGPPTVWSWETPIAPGLWGRHRNEPRTCHTLVLPPRSRQRVHQMPTRPPIQPPTRPPIRALTRPPTQRAMEMTGMTTVTGIMTGMTTGMTRGMEPPTQQRRSARELTSWLQRCCRSQHSSQPRAHAGALSWDHQLECLTSP